MAAAPKATPKVLPKLLRFFSNAEISFWPFLRPLLSNVDTADTTKLAIRQPSLILFLC